MNCIELGNSGVTPELCGNKAYLLSRASPYAHVAKGIIVTTSAFDQFIESNSLTETIQIASLNIEASQSTQQAIREGSFDASLLAEIEQTVAGLKFPVIVRSSATVEDTAALSFAGLFDSYHLVNREDLGHRIKQVYASLFNKRVIQYAQDHGIDLRKIKMGVIIQESIQGEKFGVGFQFKDSGKLVSIIESTTETSATVTSGKTIPDTYVLSEGHIYKYPQRLNINSLFEYELRAIHELMESFAGEVFPMDIEWGITGTRLYLLQLRPLTKEVPFPRGEQLFSGLPASPGVACGDAWIWQKQKEVPEQGPKKILIAQEVEIGDVAIINRFAGIVLEVSGLTAHAATLAREYGIPCIVGVDGITKIITSGEKVCIDGTAGKVTLPHKEGLSIPRHYHPFYIDPRNLQCFQSGRHLILFYPQESATIVYHAGLESELSSLITALQEKIGGPLLDGGVDVWYGYSSILEMGQLEPTIYQNFLDVLDITDTLNTQMIEKGVETYLTKCQHYLTLSKKYLNSYIESSARQDLGDALQHADFAFAYWKIVGYGMLYDYAENLLHARQDPSDLQRFFRERQEHKSLRVLSEKVVGLVTQLLERIKQDLSIDHSTYTSEMALLRAMKDKI